MNLVEKTYNEISNYLHNSLEHKTKYIDYILVDPKSKETYTLCSNGIDEAIEFTSKNKDSVNGYWNVPEWDYNFDYYIFNQLEEGLKIGYMTPEVHYSIWNSIKELYPTDLEYKHGVKEYINYCKNNNITKEFIDKETSLNTPNIMMMFKDKERNEER